MKPSPIFDKPVSFLAMIILAACQSNNINSNFTTPPTFSETITPTQTLTRALSPTITATFETTEVDIETSTLYHELSPQELAEKKLVGSGFEIKTEYQGVPVDLTVVTSNATLKQYGQVKGCMPNQEMVKYGASAEDRMEEMVFLGHYVGYLRDKGLTEKNYTFEKYMADLKAGKDRSYTIWGPKLDGTDGEYEVNPLSPIEYVTTNEKIDPDGNGTGTALLQDNSSHRGFQQLENGGVRIVEDIGKNGNFFAFCITSSEQFRIALLSLGVTLDQLQGRFQLGLPNNYPNTQTELSKVYTDLQIFKNFDGLISWGLLAP